MQVQFYGVTSVAAGEKTQLFQPDGVEFWTRRLAIIGKGGSVDHVVLFADTEAAIALPGEDHATALQAETTPQTRFQIGDKVTPTEADDSFPAGSINTIRELREKPTGQWLLLDNRHGQLCRYPASQFRLADSDPFEATF